MYRHQVLLEKQMDGVVKALGVWHRVTWLNVASYDVAECGIILRVQ